MWQDLFFAPVMNPFNGLVFFFGFRSVRNQGHRVEFGALVVCDRSLVSCRWQPWLLSCEGCLLVGQSGWAQVLGREMAQKWAPGVRGGRRKDQLMDYGLSEVTIEKGTLGTGV